MTATDELRALLDERGVEHYDGWSGEIRYTKWQGIHGMWFLTHDSFGTDGELLYVQGINMTPEEAVAATLGPGTCELIEFADVPFNVDYEVEGYDSSSGKDYAALAECSACGALIIVPPAYHRALTCDDDTVYMPYEYCPSCGNKVEEVQ